MGTVPNPESNHRDVTSTERLPHDLLQAHALVSSQWTMWVFPHKCEGPLFAFQCLIYSVASPGWEVSFSQVLSL